jgi:hypothetical protein
VTVKKLDTVTLCVYSRIGTDLSRFAVDHEYWDHARTTVRRLIAARLDEADVIGPWSHEHERRTVACLAEELLTWHEEVEPLWEIEK